MPRYHHLRPKKKKREELLYSCINDSHMHAWQKKRAFYLSAVHPVWRACVPGEKNKVAKTRSRQPVPRQPAHPGQPLRSASARDPTSASAGATTWLVTNCLSVWLVCLVVHYWLVTDSRDRSRLRLADSHVRARITLTGTAALGGCVPWTRAEDGNCCALHTDLT